MLRQTGHQTQHLAEACSGAVGLPLVVKSAPVVGSRRGHRATRAALRHRRRFGREPKTLDRSGTQFIAHPEDNPRLQPTALRP